MTKEDKELLLKDLSARLLYKPIVHAEWDYRDEPPYYKLKHAEADRTLEINDFYAIWNVKPYLRPMSSMTDEEKFRFNHLDLLNYENDGFEMANYRQIDWLNAYHFDYRGLIEKGLALEAPEGMYNFSKKIVSK